MRDYTKGRLLLQQFCSQDFCQLKILILDELVSGQLHTGGKPGHWPALPRYRAGSGRVQAEAVAPAAGLFQATSVTK
jgi:hypothetical protein